jgi:hypothetical protein
MVLTEDGKCRICNKSSYVDELADGDGRLEINTVDNEEERDDLSKLVEGILKSDTQKELDEIKKRKLAKIRKVKITSPGTPPSDYNDDEVKYYKEQWSKYEDYYRDPTIFPLLHNLIILEIELNYVCNLILGTRGEFHEKLIKHRTDIIRNMVQIRDQLPSDEAMELSEDEKALSLMYEKYIIEAKKRRSGDIKRMLDLPTLALAPVLHFKPDLVRILNDLGYKTIDVDAIASKIKELPEDPFEIALALGFPINEEVVGSEDEDGYYVDNESLPNSVAL